jgi:hypothetical protein
VRNILVLLASGALAVGLLLLNIFADLRRAAAQTASARPNIVFILTDDMRKSDLRYMPRTRSCPGPDLCSGPEA